MTGFSTTVRRTVSQRAEGKCERCGCQPGVEYHHRRARGMGSTKRPDTNTAANCLLLCAECHRDVESHRGTAINQGWLVSQNHFPADIPVNYRGAWMYLDDVGNMQSVQGELA